jgi:ATP-binding cassette subfamily B multidrug efflux pump
VSLLKLSYFYRWPFRVLILLLALGAAMAGLIGPFFQKAFVDRLMGSAVLLHPNAATQWLETCAPMLLIFFAFLATVLGQAMNLLNNYIGVREGIFLQRVFSERLYGKTLSLRADRLTGTTTGEVVSIYATDVAGATLLVEQSVPMAASIFFPLVLAPIAIQWIVHIPLQNTLIVMLFMVALNLIFATKQSRYFTMFKLLAAERTGLVNEWVQNIRLLRILGWVEDFEAKIFSKRKEETVNRVAMVTNGQMMNTFGSTVTYVINLTGVAGLVFFRSEHVTPGELFALLWIFGAFLTKPFRMFPWLFTMSMDSLTSLRRLQRFLDRPGETPGRTPVSKDENVAASVSKNEQGLSLEVKALNLTIGGASRLSDVEFEIAAGEFVAIIGEVGSGKSLLMLSLMGETGATFGSFQIGAQDALAMELDERRRLFAFVPQEGFVISASLRENIAFEYDSEKNADGRVRRALQLAQFPVDVEYAVGGLDTEIGERGVNLSGGQRQRVSLARAQYFNRPVILLDDSLSALDVDTENSLIRDLIRGDWRQKTRILITHRLSVLSHVDRILFIENGQVVENGKLVDLMARSARMRRFVASVHRSEGGHGIDASSITAN